MTESHEDHLHLLVCIDRLNGAWKTLNAVEASGTHPLVGPAFRYALVEYATAFTRSDGPLNRNRTLPLSLVPIDKQELHKRIIGARHQTHAHADLTALDAVLHVEYINGTKHVSHIQNQVHGLEELKNIVAIISLVESVLDNLYVMHRSSANSIAP